MYSTSAYRFRKSVSANARRYRMTAGLFLAILLFLFKIFSLLTIQPSPVEIVSDIPDRIIAFYQREPLKILKTVIPVLGWRGFEGDAGELTTARALLNSIEGFGRVSLNSPAAVLQSQIPLLASMKSPNAVVVNRLDATVSDDSSMAKTVSTLSGDCLVAIYNTHTGETYSQTDGVERLDGRRGGVVMVAAALQEALESKYGIKAARSDRINDANYNTAYLESEKTARELLAANPKTRTILDVHRDSGKTREQSLVNINGQEVAPILFIVGSDTRRPFPGWRQNQDFANQLSAKMNELYPGLSLGVRVKDGLYNQFLHPHAVLVEMGTSKNSTEEAVRSARLLADVLAGFVTGKDADKNTVGTGI